MKPGQAGCVTDDEAALVAAAKIDGEAFTTLYHRYRQPIFHYCRARAPSGVDPDDLTQQVFLKAFEAIPRYEERGVPFRSWLYRLAHNVVIDACRRPDRTVPLQLFGDSMSDAGMSDPEARALDVDAWHRFHQLICPLDADRQHLLTLRFVLDLPTAEIAIILGKRDSAVRAQLSRAIATLKEQQHGR
jgi:RNA polymerase sigma-70 factor (ECF subfamily)